jgi:hypothetical protein
MKYPLPFGSTASIKVLVVLISVIGLLLGSLSSFSKKMGFHFREDGTQYLQIDSHPAHEVTALMQFWPILWTIGGIPGIDVRV